MKAEEALDSIRHGKFNFILLILAMPEFSGLDVINSLKEEAMLDSNNVVIFTASSESNCLRQNKE